MVKLSEIKLADATARDMARALNFAMKKSSKTRAILTNQLNLSGKIKPQDVIDNLYPKDTFTKLGKLTPEMQLTFAQEMTQILKRPRNAREFNMLDYAKTFMKVVTQKR